MEDSDAYMNGLQTQWRKDHIANQQPGKHDGKEYDWILPEGLWEEGLWQGIRTGQPKSLPTYLAQTGVQKHDGVHNLKSSWMQCANLYFPFREDLLIVTGFFRKALWPQIEAVEGI